MDEKDTFHTFKYKGGYIHTCQNRTQCREEVKVQFPSGGLHLVKSVRAAKIRITRATK